MKKLTLAMLAGVLMLGLSYQTPEIAKAEEPSSDALKTTCEGLRNSLLNGTAAELFNKLAPWLRGRAELWDECLPDYSKEMFKDHPEEMRADLEKSLRSSLVDEAKRGDPADTLKIKTFEDVLALDAATMYSLDIGQMRMQADESADVRRAAKWHEVNRATYKANRTVAGQLSDEPVEQLVGIISFANRFHDIVLVSCVAAADTWQVTGFWAILGDWHLDLNDSEMMVDPTIKNIEANTEAAKKTEAEQLMGSGRDHSRVQYAKTGSAPKQFSDSMEDFEDMFTGVYFKLRDTIYKKPDMERGAIVAEPVDDEDLGYAALYFNYVDGESEVEWYDTKDELEEALKAFQTAK